MTARQISESTPIALSLTIAVVTGICGLVFWVGSVSAKVESVAERQDRQGQAYSEILKEVRATREEVIEMRGEVRALKR